jgi:hypothetical protein
MADFTYSFEEFSDHLAAMDIVQQYEDIWTPGAGHIEITSDQPNFMTASLKVMDYMRQLYKDEQEVFFKGSRFTIIMNFIAHHLDDFETARLAVRGVSESLLAEPAWRAVHQIFTAPDWLSHGRDVTIQEVIEAARTYEKRNGAEPGAGTE